MYAEIEGNPQNGTDLGHRPLAVGMPGTIENVPLHTCVLLPDQTVRKLLNKSA